MKIAAASLSVTAALFVGTVTALAGTNPTPVISATLSGTQPSCSYVVSASTTDWQAGTWGATVYRWSGGTPGVGTRTVVFGDPNGDPAPVQAGIFWSTTTTAPENAASRIVLSTTSPSITSFAVATVDVPDGYAGTCAPAPTPTATATAAPIQSTAPAVTTHQAATSGPAPAHSTTAVKPQAPASNPLSAPVVAQAQPQARRTPAAPAHAVALVGSTLASHSPIAGIPTWALALFALGLLIGAALMLNLLRSRSVTR